MKQPDFRARLANLQAVPEQGNIGGAAPAVSVIIATYNAGPLLGQALNALAVQSLPEHLIEIIVVDDGSTDDTWRCLSELHGIRSNLKIFQQPHTGGPSAGRNRGLSEATGSYVFFHDADDFLGSDALQRLVDLAQQQDSDIVIPRVSWFGKPGAKPASTRTVLDADVVDNGVWGALTPHKLVRRSLIEALELRFNEDMVQGEDQVFMATCLFAARKISILGGKNIYNRRLLPDNSNLSRQRQTLANKRLTTTRMVALVVANTTPGERRDRLLGRIFIRTLSSALNRPFMAASPEERKAFLEVMHAAVFPHMPPSVLGELADPQRLRMITAQIGKAEDLVELNGVLRRPLSYALGDLPTYTLGPHLDQLLSVEDRQAGAPRLPSSPTLCEVSMSRRRLTLMVRLEETSASSTGPLRLAAWLSGSPDFVDLGPGESRRGSALTFKISARRFLRDESGSFEHLGDGLSTKRQWILLLQASTRGKMTAASPITVPSDALQPLAANGETRDFRVHVGATPRGLVVVTTMRTSRPSLWHRHRLVV